MTSKSKPHHHGNLREALISAGIELLAYGGLSALTLRACAAKVGVSHAAPAHHFKGLPGLLSAIGEVGFRTFADTMEEEREKAGADNQARLAGICQGYLRFARENNALFLLMFSTDKEFLREPGLKSQADRAYRVLAEACAPFARDPSEARHIESTVWSLVHGYAMLARFGQFDNEPRPGEVTFEALFGYLKF